jgi:hypothetical protein
MLRYIRAQTPRCPRRATKRSQPHHDCQLNLCETGFDRLWRTITLVLFHLHHDDLTRSQALARHKLSQHNVKCKRRRTLIFSTSLPSYLPTTATAGQPHLHFIFIGFRYHSTTASILTSEKSDPFSFIYLRIYGTMEYHDTLRKAAGSSDLRHQYHEHPVSASPSQPTYSRPPFSRYDNNDVEREASASQKREYHHAPSSPPNSQPKAPLRRMSSNTATSPAAQIQDRDSTSSEEWTLLEEGESQTVANP